MITATSCFEGMATPRVRHIWVTKAASFGADASVITLSATDTKTYPLKLAALKHGKVSTVVGKVHSIALWQRIRKPEAQRCRFMFCIRYERAACNDVVRETVLRVSMRPDLDHASTRRSARHSQQNMNY